MNFQTLCWRWVAHPLPEGKVETFVLQNHIWFFSPHSLGFALISLCLLSNRSSHTPELDKCELAKEREKLSSTAAEPSRTEPIIWKEEVKSSERSSDKPMAKDSSFPKGLKAIYSWNCALEQAFLESKGPNWAWYLETQSFPLGRMKVKETLVCRNPLWTHYGFLAQDGPAMGQLSHSVTCPWHSRCITGVI